MKIGILETGEVSPDLKARHGDYPAMFEAMLGAADPGLEFVTVRVVAGEMPRAPGEADAWLVTGSRHGVYDGLPWIEPLKAFLRACVAARVPVVGICFGHQILAEALGGRVEKSDKGWGLGVQDYELVAARLGHRLAGPLRGARPASGPGGHAAARRHRAGPLGALRLCGPGLRRPRGAEAISLQPHPEFGAEFMDDLIALRTGTVLAEDAATEARAGLVREVHSENWARLIVGYLQRMEATRAAA